MYTIWVDDGDGWFIYKKTNHYPDVEKALAQFDECYYDANFSDEEEE